MLQLNLFSAPELMIATEAVEVVRLKRRLMLKLKCVEG